MPNITNRIKVLSNYFASKWCYDWNNARFLCNEPACVSFQKSKEVFEIRSRIWAVNTQSATLQLTEEINHLTIQQLLDCRSPTCAADTADADCINSKINDFYLLNIDSKELDYINEGILNKAIELQASENEEWIASHFFIDDEDELTFTIPNVHPILQKSLRKACQKLAKKRKAKLTSSTNKNYDLQLETVPPVKLVFGQEVSISEDLIGQGLAILNGMALDYSPNAMGRAAKFHDWLKKMSQSGHKITNVKGVFNGTYAEGILVVAVSDIAFSDAFKIAAQTGVRAGLFLDQNRLLSVI